MVEVEAKVKLSPKDVKRLRQVLPKMAKFKKKTRKRDQYIGYHPQYSFRIRSEEEAPTLHLKRKKMKQGIEMNDEIDLSIQSSKAALNLLRKVGIKMPLKKIKRGEVYQYGRNQIELNYISKLGYFLEIENVVESEAQIPQAKKELFEVFKTLGFKPKDFEHKYYLELLANL